MRPIYDGGCPKCDDNLISYMPYFSEEEYMEVEIECPNCGWSVMVKANVISIEEGE